MIHKHYDFLPLTYASLVETPMVTTIHGFTHYISISDSDRHPDLSYVATVHHGIDLAEFTFRPQPGSYPLFFGRIHPDKGAADAIRVARAARLPLILAGIVQDLGYFDREVKPYLGADIRFVVSVGPVERNALLGGALGLLHLIHFDEPFGLSVVEAMACGTPVIAYARGSMMELIVPGTKGFLVTNESSAIEAVGSLAILDRRTVMAHANARFRSDRLVDGYLRAYRSILSG